MNTDPSRDATFLKTRGPELGVAVFLMGIAALVIVDSLRVGIGWADDGPRSGEFPFYVGLLLLAASGGIAVNTLRFWRQASGAFATRAQLRTVFAMLLPMLAYVAAIAGLGLYVASTALIGYFMRRHGRYGWLVTAGVAIGVPVLVYVVFERWFLVPLPKGPLEQALGL